MIRVVSILKHQIPISVFLIGGPEKYKKYYQNLAKKLKLNKDEAIIRSSVKPSEVPIYIATFDIACMLYPDTHHFRDKMSPQKAIEYMAMDRPILASDLPSIRQILSSELAYLVKPGDQKKLEAMILKVYQHYNQAIEKAKKARKQVQNFTWEKRQKIILES